MLTALASQLCSWQPSAGRLALLLAELVPALLVDLDAIFVGGFLDPLPRFVAFRIADAFDLVEARNRVSHMTGIVERLLALFRKRKLIFVKLVALLFAEFGHGCSFPGPNVRAAIA